MDESLSGQEMLQLDTLLTDEYGVSKINSVELVGFHLANLIRQKVSQDQNITGLIGKGYNAGGVLVACRWLAGWGYEIDIVLSTPPSKCAPQIQSLLDTLKKFDIPFHDYIPVSADVLIDGLLGFHLVGNARGRVKDIIVQANGCRQVMVFSLDVPSGMDPDIGGGEYVIQANYTLCLGALKHGMLTQRGKASCGNIKLLDIGIPQREYIKLGLEQTAQKLFKKPLFTV